LSEWKQRADRPISADSRSVKRRRSAALFVAAEGVVGIILTGTLLPAYAGHIRADRR
jgi:hypothetical protein